jgi:hypothetical protein
MESPNEPSYPTKANLHKHKTHLHIRTNKNPIRSLENEGRKKWQIFIHNPDQTDHKQPFSSHFRKSPLIISLQTKNTTHQYDLRCTIALYSTEHARKSPPFLNKNRFAKNWSIRHTWKRNVAKNDTLQATRKGLGQIF